MTINKLILILAGTSVAALLSALVSSLLPFIICYTLAFWALGGVVILSVIKSLRKGGRLLRIAFIILIPVSIGLFLFRISSGRRAETGKAGRAALKSLPYLTWTSASGNFNQSGITRYNRLLASPGWNLYAPRNLPRAYLIDMKGEVIHKWEARVNPDDTWQQVEPAPHGDLLAIVKDRLLLRLDRHSRIKWVKKIRAHHDIALDRKNNIYLLIRRDELVSRRGFPLPVINDYLVKLSPDGQIRQEVSFYRMLKDKVSARAAAKIYLRLLRPGVLLKIIGRKIGGEPLFDNGSPFDIFHTNSIEIIPRKVGGLASPGDILFSCLMPDLIGIINLKDERVTWQWGPGILDKQHAPSLLPNGHILIFDNGYHRGYSRIIEVDPLTGEIVWQYQSRPPEDFFSVSRGACQRFPNGNTLITDSDSGRVFEITRGGEIVWEFYNPELKRDKKQRSAIYRMTRFPPAYFSDFTLPKKRR